jgi:hypothetical protein
MVSALTTTRGLGCRHHETIVTDYLAPFNIDYRAMHVTS